MTELLKFIHGAPSADLLGDNLPLFETCLDWVHGELPGFVVRDHTLGSEKFIH